jgi:SecD/SecF fusion protein
LIVALCAYAWKKREPRLGLDLAGGSSLTYQVKLAEGELTPDRVKRTIDVVDKRLNGIGVSEISIVPTQQNEIVIELPGRTAEQIKDIKALVERNGSLEFRIQADAKTEREWRELKDQSDVLPKDKDEVKWYPRKEGGPDMLVKAPERRLLDELNKLKKRKRDELIKQGAADIAAKGTAEGSPEFAAALKAYEASPAYADAWAKFEATDEFKTAQRAYEDKKLEEVFVGDDLVKTEIQHQPGQIVVFFSFKDERKPWFGQFTEKHQGENMAIILDGKVDSAPVIKSKLPGEGIIEGGRGATGFSETEAKALAIVLESGSTGVTLSLSREESLGPSLGEVAIRHGLWSIGVGFLLVVVLMVFYYRLPGMVANFALLLNLVILLGVMNFFRSAFTLPGIAGIVLTLGMAVDANILIFERYREERHRGKPVPEALAAGYDRAFSAIIDTHATTILTAVVLIAMGTGSVKGFGVSLTVGLIASFFTAFFVTRWIFEWAIEKGIATNLTLGPDKKTPTIDYMHNRRWFTGPSFVLMILGAVAYMMRDDYSKRDLEFVGGQEAIVQLAKPISAEDADKRVKADKKYDEASVVTLGGQGAVHDSFRIRAKAANQKEGEEFLVYLRDVAFKDLLVSEPYTQESVEKLKTGGVRATMAMHVVGDAGDPAKLKTAIETAGLSDVDVQKDPAASGVIMLKATDAAAGASLETIKTRIGEAAKKVEPKIALSDPFPSKSFLEKSRAEDLYRSAVWAILVSLLIQVVYIRLRYANYNYGVAAVIAIAHDVPIALGAVTLCDMTGLVYAKVNLVLIAAFLTLIGYSMNDTVVVYDRIRENLGRSRVIVSHVINDAVNQVIVRSIRTSMTVWVVVLVQFLFSHGTGSVLEGFAFVMVVGVISGTYSSIFIAAPLLMFLPHYWKKFSAKPSVAAAMVVVMMVGAVMTLTAPSGSPRMWIGAALAFNIVIHFLAHLFPWLTHPDPDSFVRDQVEREQDERPLTKPGI